MLRDKMPKFLFCLIWVLAYSILSTLVWAGETDDMTAGSRAQSQGKYDEAIMFYTRVIESGKIEEILSTVYEKRGKCYEAKGLYDNALEDYTKALVLEPGNALFYVCRAVAYSKRGMGDRAIEDLGAAIKLQPDYEDAYYNRGMAYLGKKFYDKAIADFTEVIKLNPQRADAYRSRGKAYEKKGIKDKAAEDLKKAKQLGANLTLEGCLRMSPVSQKTI